MSRKFTGIVVLLVWGICSGIAATGKIPVFGETTSNPPVLDGILTDDCWKLGKWNEGFKMLETPSENAEIQTKFKICTDGNNIYIGMIIDEPFPEKIVKKNTLRDGPVYRDDCIELFFDTNKDKSSYYHFVINPNGTVYDAVRRQGGHVGTSAWNSSDLKVASAVNKDNWTLEIAIPLVDFDLGKDNVFGFNITRQRHAGGRCESSSFTPLSGNFHQPENFSELNLKDATLEKYKWELKEPYDMLTLSKNGEIKFDFKTYLQNKTGKYHFIKIKAFLNGNEAIEMTNGLDNNSGKELTFSIPAKDNGNINIMLQIYDRKTGDALALKQFIVDVAYNPISIELTEPSYRNCIFATQKISTLKGKIKIGIDDIENLAIALKVIGNENILVSSNISCTKRETEFSFPLPELPEGNYKLVAELKNIGKTLYSTELLIKKLPPFDGETRIDENLVTRINGKPFLAYGWYSGVNIREAGKNGCNAIADYNAYFKSDRELKEWLDLCHDNGIKALIYPYPERCYVNTDSFTRPLSEKEKTGIRDFVKKWKNHSAILGWMIADEPELRPALPDRIKAIYEICKDEDPYHPCTLANDTIPGIFKYINGADIFTPDPYPLFLENSLTGTPIEKVGKFIEAIHEAGKNKKTAWVVPQAFNYGDFRNDRSKSNRAPNFHELRNMQYQVVIEGGTGFLWFNYWSTRSYPDTVLGIPFLGKEANIIRDLILSPTKRISIKTGDEYVKAVCYKNICGADWIIAVNNATTEKKVKITLPWENAPKKWYVLSEERSVEAENGLIEHTFETYDTEIYTTDKEIAAKLSVNKILKEIEALKKSYIRPGNIARDAKTINFSSAQGGRPEFHLRDGARNDAGWRAGKPGKQWVEFEFIETRKTGKVNVFTENEFSENPEIHINKNGKWIKTGEFKKVSESKFESVFSPVDTDKINFFFPSPVNGSVAISEIEIY
ncbi:MAG: hypothetical protein A2017_21870 [Lentisphaerae bacterium GWF2_44_16]|nr:MAG: hypothetical protein A2017_21870 [Lentisphaerae bacterium GWF2_44_16]